MVEPGLAELRVGEPCPERSDPLVRGRVDDLQRGGPEARSRGEGHAPKRAADALGYEQSELTFAGLATVPAARVRPPRVAASPVAFECRTSQVVPVGTARIVIGEVVHIHVDDAVIDDRHRIDPDRLAPIGRMAGSAYTRTHDRFSIADEGFFPGRSRRTIAS